MAKAGSIEWRDLTVPNAGEVADFYAAVVGWRKVGHPMDGYEDFEMHSDHGCQAGVCYRRGSNANLPSQWLIYITVADMTTALASVVERGGRIIDGPRPMGGQFACIEDPAGAVCALWQPPDGETSNSP